MADEDFCSHCARPFATSELTERGSELICDDCLAGRTREDPEADALAEALGRRTRWPGPLDMAITGGIAVALGVGWALIMAPLSPWWALFLAAAPLSCGGYLKLRCDADNNGTAAWALAVGAAVPVTGFLAHVAAHGSPPWITLFLIPFGAAVGLVSTIGLRR
jgi:hypothetical protein